MKESNQDFPLTEWNLSYSAFPQWHLFWTRKGKTAGQVRWNPRSRLQIGKLPAFYILLKTQNATGPWELIWWASSLGETTATHKDAQQPILQGQEPNTSMPYFLPRMSHSSPLRFILLYSTFQRRKRKLRKVEWHSNSTLDCSGKPHSLCCVWGCANLWDYWSRTLLCCGETW